MNVHGPHHAHASFRGLQQASWKGFGSVFDWDLLKMSHDHGLAQGLRPSSEFHSLVQGLRPSSEFRSSAQGLHPSSELVLGPSACRAAAVERALGYDLFQGGVTPVCSELWTPLGYFLAEASCWASWSASNLEPTGDLCAETVQPEPYSAMPCGMAAPLSAGDTVGLLQASL